MRILSTLAILVCFMPPRGYGVCEAPRPRLVCAEYFNSKAVVTAQLIRAKTIVDNDGLISAHVYSMRTIKVIHGSVSSDFEVYESNDSGRATFDWSPGNSYLLFLNHFSNGEDWGLDGCGNSGPMKSSKSALTQIRDVRKAQDGLIQVAVGTSTISLPAMNVPVSVGSEDHAYTATTNKAGVAEIKVPAGQYSVQVLGYRAFELSYEDPE